MFKFLSFPERAYKPRSVGITHVLDKGMGLREAEDLLDTCASHIDIIKLGWGTGYVTQNVVDKIKIYQKAGIPVCFGGTLLELVILQNRFDEFRRGIQKAGLTHVEISTGVIDMPVREKSRYIKELAKDFVVLSEVGSKDSEKVIPPYRWVELISADLDAGASKVICEARESGTVGLYFGTGEVRAGLIDEIVAKIDCEDLIFEAPQKSQQLWLIRKFGPDVNLGNIATSDVIPLETLRLGLRADTMEQFHPVAAWNSSRAMGQELKVVPKKKTHKAL